MGLKEYIKKYKSYESTELERRRDKKKKLRAYKALASMKRPAKNKKPLRMTARGITRAINNPYGVKFPKAKRSKKSRKKIKKIIVYK